jgi:hypothetical protein
MFMGDIALMLENRPVTVIALLLAVFLSAPAWADNGAAKLDHPAGLKVTIPATAAAEKENAPLRLTSNKNELIRLDQDAVSVIVNNPDHASVMLDSARLLIVMPHMPGTTSFTVLGSDGEVILQKDVIVTNVQPKYVRVRRICAGSDASCIPAAYYYCPDGCYEVTPVASGGDGNVPPPPGGPSASAADSSSGSGEPQQPDSGTTIQVPIVP